MKLMTFNEAHSPTLGKQHNYYVDQYLQNLLSQRAKSLILNIANEKQPYLILGDFGLGSIGLANKYYYKSM